ncbi:hypothetical protein Tco_0211687 [Tanacetum coccineum]
MVTDNDPDEQKGSGKVCINSKVLDFIHDRVSVTVNGRDYSVLIKEIANWIPNILKSEEPSPSTSECESIDGTESDENKDVLSNGSTTNIPDVNLNPDNNTTIAADKSISNENEHVGDEKVRDEKSSNAARPKHNDVIPVDTRLPNPLASMRNIDIEAVKNLLQKIIEAVDLSDIPMGGRAFIQVNKFIVFKNKLKNVKAKLKDWIKTEISKRNGTKASLLHNLKSIDQAIGNEGGYTQNLATHRMDILKNIASIEKLESLDLDQKSRRHWCAHRDDNTKFFHATLKRKHKKLVVSGVMSNGMWITNPTQVKNNFLDFFSSKFNAFNGISISHPSPHLKSLTSSQREFLSSDFTESEIKDAV